jgi:transcriptional regulator with XRE-family HTH domain
VNKKLLEVIKGHYEGYTQRQIAVRANMPEPDVSLIWTGKRGLTIETLCKLADGIPYDYAEIWKEAE